VERNTEVIHALQLPLAMKYAIVGAQAATWKWFYYASNTLKLLHANKPNAPSKKELEASITVVTIVTQVLQGDPWHQALALDFVFRIAGVPFLVHFIGFPLLAGCFLHGSWFCWYTFANLVGAELVTNVHAFCTIVTNHAGADLWWFDGPCKADTPEFYLRAVLGSTAYTAGGDFIDYWHGYLNYQGEHHAFPDLSPLHYQRLHPRFKAVCATHGVPYVQESVLVRTRKTCDIIVGKAKHKCCYGNAADQPNLWSIGSPN
jgi:hypothetical protein